MTKERSSLNFLEQIIVEDIKSGKAKEIITRFPPEPNGYIHIGHTKAIWVNFSIAEKYGGKTNLRFDDTNPTTEETKFVNSIKEDIAWLGFKWDNEYYASDYFEQLYNFAEQLIIKGYAYVDDSTAEEIAALKGTPTQAGKDSPYRDRSVEENLDLFRKMRAGDFEEGEKVLRAKIDMAHTNMLMRDPLMYRIKKEDHHRTGDTWCIYPMYDFAHGQSDSIEEITHSMCSLEFIHHRPLYDWFIEKLGIYPSKQREFARMNVSYMITSKRKLKHLVADGVVTGWDDPRMPTVAGMRRRGYPAKGLVRFCEKTGIAKRNNLQEIALLESCIKDELNRTAHRVMVVQDPLKLTIDNYPEDQVEWMEAENNPENEADGTRKMPFTKHLYIEQKDFMEDAPKKFFRMSQGRNVRLKHAYILHCKDVVKDESGKVIEVICDYYPDSKSGSDTSGVKAKGTLHWVSVEHAKACTIRNYDRLFKVEAPGTTEGIDFMDELNENSLSINTNAFMEPALADYKVGDTVQFMRSGYYRMDEDSNDAEIIFNRTVSLRDSWKKGK